MKAKQIIDSEQTLIINGTDTDGNDYNMKIAEESVEWEP